eukprot:2784084-Rhodomonas_salina.2
METRCRSDKVRRLRLGEWKSQFDDPTDEGVDGCDVAVAFKRCDLQNRTHNPLSLHTNASRAFAGNG